MADPFIGEIRAWAMNWAPEGWAWCDGQTVSTYQFQALYSLIANVYGPSTPSTTFTLPDLRGRTPMAAGNPNAALVAQGMPPSIAPGQAMGSQSVTLSDNQMPNHTHQAVAALALQSTLAAAPATNVYVSRPTGPPIPLVANAGVTYPAWNVIGPADSQMSLAMIGVQGGGGAHENRQPYLTVNFCIALEGVYPQFS